MYKFIAQLVISATVGLAVAAGCDADVRGYIGEALREPGVYIQESANAIANVNISTQADANVSTDANGSANSAEEVISTTENAVDLSAQSTGDMQVNSALNAQNILPDFLGLEADAGVDAETQTGTSAETDEVDLSLWQQLGLSLGFGLSE